MVRGYRLYVLVGVLLVSALGRAAFRGRERSAVHAASEVEARLLDPPRPRALATESLAKRVRAEKSRPDSRRVAGVSTVNAPLTDAHSAVFSSREACETQVALGQRASRTKGTARLSSWNVRWFPDGVAGNSASGTQATDVAWLACAISYLDVDAIALEEVKSKSRSSAALAALVERLEELTGEEHGYRIDDCPDSSGQHLAWVWSKPKVTVQSFAMHAALNPHGDSCAKQLRPGLGVTLKFPNGLDLHAIAVHLKSGTTLRDLGLRKQSWAGLERVVDDVTSRSGERDVVVLGDLNTMGAPDSDDAQRGAAENLLMDGRLAALRQPLRRLPSDVGCSEYYQRKPSLLDHFLVTRATTEVLAAAKTETYGVCRTLGCEAYSGDAPAALNQLSDHCPIVLELTDADWD